MRTLTATTMTLILLAVTSSGTAAQETDGPTTTDGLIAGMDTEEVEPGVLRIVNDGLRDLSRSFEARSPDEAMSMAFGPFGDVTIGLDGSVWLDVGDGHISKVGTKTALGLPEGVSRSSDRFNVSEVQVDQDGMPWIAVTEETGRLGAGQFRAGLYAHDGDRWERRFERSNTWNQGMEFRLGLDGSVWALTATQLPGTFRFFRLDGDRWTRVARPPAPADSPDHQIRSWGIAADGTLWMARKRAIARFDGEDWEIVGRLPQNPNNSLAFDPDGAVHTILGSEGERIMRTHRGADDWERSGVPEVPGEGGAGVAFEALAPDGSLWRALSTTESCGFFCGYVTACGGVARYDGGEWERFLEGRCVHELDFDVDGNTWVRASEPNVGEPVTLVDGREVQPLGMDRVDLYLIGADAPSLS